MEQWALILIGKLMVIKKSVAIILLVLIIVAIIFFTIYYIKNRKSKKTSVFDEYTNVKSTTKNSILILATLSIILFFISSVIICVGLFCGIISVFSLSKKLGNVFILLFSSSLIFSIPSLVLAIISLVKYKKEKKKGNTLPRFIFKRAILGIVLSSYIIVGVMWPLINAFIL